MDYANWQNNEAVNDPNRPRLFYVFRLHTQHISHCLGSFFLCRCSDMGVGVQRKTCGEVTQHAGDRLNVHSVLEGDGCEGVPLRYNYDKPGKP